MTSIRSSKTGRKTSSVASAVYYVAIVVMLINENLNLRKWLRRFKYCIRGNDAYSPVSPKYGNFAYQHAHQDENYFFFFFFSIIVHLEKRKRSE